MKRKYQLMYLIFLGAVYLVVPVIINYIVDLIITDSIIKIKKINFIFNFLGESNDFMRLSSVAIAICILIVGIILYIKDKKINENFLKLFRFFTYIFFSIMLVINMVLWSF